MRRFFVDDVPIRRYAEWSAWTFPRRPMWVYGSIWDASSWATDDGKYRADYRFQPFVARFTHFIARGCTAASPPSCRPPPSSPAGFGLSRLQRAAMEWAQRRSLVYDYCRDPKRDHSLTPECRRF
ncbi:probable xyloglucan endotransglucosylase/hydrolase protein 32 [Dendrobium catenatum]|uniref:probable xyloglucan endotransglucosylase/hydrolase protein 32 n=1 Tax=Dendrobium catenatum TaxID=906689 RepID=UPI00109FBE37|nr:probable xyloglucan endotransglucosylase/hydrolase protein 32 [Dendrobium catenatum]